MTDLCQPKKVGDVIGGIKYFTIAGNNHEKAIKCFLTKMVKFSIEMTRRGSTMIATFSIEMTRCGSTIIAMFTMGCKDIDKNIANLIMRQNIASLRSVVFNTITPDYVAFTLHEIMQNDINKVTLIEPLISSFLIIPCHVHSNLHYCCQYHYHHRS